MQAWRGPGEELGALGEKEGGCILNREKLWRARGLWRQSWALGQRPRLTSLGLESRFATIPPESAAHPGPGCQAA